MTNPLRSGNLARSSAAFRLPPSVQGCHFPSFFPHAAQPSCSSVRPPTPSILVIRNEMGRRGPKSRYANHGEKLEARRRRYREKKNQAQSSPPPRTERGHIEVTVHEDLPYSHVKHLGMGGYGTVDMVKDTTNGQYFARKILRKRFNEDLESVKIQFLNEIQIMKRLSRHHHIVHVISSYICATEFAFILEPVADGGSLAHFLTEVRNKPSDTNSNILRRSFGCLASTLAYVNENIIRHKDISPGNILIHRGEILLTDFGISLDCNFLDGTTTTGIPGPGNRKYSVPELFLPKHGRNRKSDVFSLGCVFVDIISVLDPCLLFANIATGSYHENAEFIIQMLKSRIAITSGQLDFMPKIVYQAAASMLETYMAQRPTAGEITQLLKHNNSLFCGECRSAFC